MTFHQSIKDGEGWETLKMDPQYANPHLQVFTAQVRTPAHPEGCTWTVVHRKGAVVIVPMTAESRLILIRQERIPIRATIWEFPAGQIDESSGHNEAVVRETALRELREETGYELVPSGELISMGLFYSSVGFTDEHAHLFLARPVVAGKDGHAHETTETITGCRGFTPEELRSMIANDEIRDANTLSTYARLRAMGIL